MAAEYGDPSLSNTFHFADLGLNLLRVKIAAGMDDNVLVAAGDKEFAVRDIGQITRIQPDPIEQIFCLDRRPQIAAGSGGSLELQVPLLAVGQFTPGIVNHPYLMARQRHAS